LHLYHFLLPSFLGVINDYSPTLGLGIGLGLFNPNDIPDFELVIFIMSRILFASLNELFVNRMHDLTLYADYDSLILLITNNNTLKNSFRHISVS
jgi:hypothetical protein